MEKTFFIKSKIAILWFISFLLHAAVINRFVGWLCTDTAGYWLHAATFTGHDWSAVAKCASQYYSWGYSLLLMIPFVLAPDDMIIMSKIGIIINALLCSFTCPFLYQIGKKLFVKTNKYIIMICAFITSIYSTYFLQTAVALSEALLFFLYVFLVWLIVQYLYEKKVKWAILSGICCGYMYTVHHRTVGVLVAFMGLVLVLYIKNRSLKESFAFLIPLFLCFIISILGTRWLMAKEAAAGIYKGNTYNSMFHQILSIINLDGILSCIQNIIGAVWYILIGTLATAGIGIITVIKECGVIIIDHKHKKCAENKWTLYCFLFLSLLCCLGISVVTAAGPTRNMATRIDLIFYGRYYENILSIFIFIGLIELDNLRNNTELIKKMIFLILLMLSASIAVYYFTQMINGNGINYFSVTAILAFFSFPNLEDFSVLPISMFAIVLVALIVYMCWLGKFHEIIAYCLIAVSFLYVGYSAVTNVDARYQYYSFVWEYPTKNEDAVCMNEYIQEQEIESFGVFQTSQYDAFSYQLMNPQKTVFPISSLEEIENFQGEITHIIIPRSLKDSMYTGKLEMESSNYAIYNLSSTESY